MSIIAKLTDMPKKKEKMIIINNDK